MKLRIALLALAATSVAAFKMTPTVSARRGSPLNMAGGESFLKNDPTEEVEALDVEAEAVRLFGRLGCKKFVLAQAEATVASGYVFDAFTAMKPKWVCAGYTEREGHIPSWTQLFDGLTDDDRLSFAEFQARVGALPFAPPLGAPDRFMLGVPGGDALAPAGAARLWAALGFGGGGGTEEEGGQQGPTRAEFQAALLQGSEDGQTLLFKHFLALLKGGD
uniref:Selenoprotein O n=1 Tax=Heterosigma akashiwo TaxID=2829 RepID=A0A6V1Q1P9_HETAK